jgi:hypothetical protein
MPLPDSNDDDGFGVDPGQLYTGSGSNMFKNEHLSEKNKTRRELEAKRASLPKGIRGLVQELQDLLIASKAENDSISSYLQVAFNEDSNFDPDKIKVEFRAREMNLQLINRIQLCLDKHKPTQNP